MTFYAGAVRLMGSALLVATLVTPHAARAQSRWSLEAGLGGGRASGGGYSPNLEGLGSGQLDVAVVRRRSTEVLVGVSTNYYFGPGDVVTLACVCQPPGAACGCRPNKPGIPNFHFSAINVGIRRHLGTRFAVGAGVAIGRARVRDVGDRLGESAGIDVAVRLIEGIHFVCKGQMVGWKAESGTVRVYPVTLGFRIN